MPSAETTNQSGQAGEPTTWCVRLGQKRTWRDAGTRRRLTVEVEVVPSAAAHRATFELFRLAEADDGQQTKVRETIGDLRYGRRTKTWSRTVSVGPAGETYVAEVTLALSADAACETKSSEPRYLGPDSKWVRRWGVALGMALILAMIVGAFRLLGSPGGPWNLDNGPLLGATAILLAWFLAIGALGRLRGAVLVGQDNRVSTSKTAAFGWTAAVGFVMGYFIFLGIGDESNCGPNKDLPCTLNTLLAAEGLPLTYVLLLGAPFAALLGAQAVTEAKVESGAQQKSTSETSPTAEEAFQNDAGKTDLMDSQYLLFTLIAALFFLVSFATAPQAGLPTIPEALVALTGVSAVAYVGKKAVDRNPLEITGLDPSVPVAGETVTIIGRNFLPDGALTVKVDLDGTPLVPIKASNTQIEVEIPWQLDPSAKVLTVYTAANVSQNLTLKGSQYLTAAVRPNQVLPGGTVEIGLPRRPSLKSGGGTWTAVVGAGKAVALSGEDPFELTIPANTPAGTNQAISVFKGTHKIAEATIDIVAPTLIINPTRIASDTPFTISVPTQLQLSTNLKLRVGDESTITLPSVGLTRVVADGLGNLLSVARDFPTLATLLDGDTVVAQTEVTLIPTPSLNSVEPAQARSGDVVTVSGTGLLSGEKATVMIHVQGVLATPFLILPERIIARVDEGISEAGDVQVSRTDTGLELHP